MSVPLIGLHLQCPLCLLFSLPGYVCCCNFLCYKLVKVLCAAQKPSYTILCRFRVICLFECRGSVQKTIDKPFARRSSKPAQATDLCQQRIGIGLMFFLDSSGWTSVTWSSNVCDIKLNSWAACEMDDGVRVKERDFLCSVFDSRAPDHEI